MCRTDACSFLEASFILQLHRERTCAAFSKLSVKLFKTIHFLWKLVRPVIRVFRNQRRMQHEERRA